MSLSYLTLSLLTFFYYSSAIAVLEKDDVDTLEKLQREIKRILPSGWDVEIIPTARWREPRSDEGDSPCLLISTKESVSVQFQFPNSAPGSPPEKRSQKLDLALVAFPLVSSEQHASMLKTNSEKTNTRLNFMNKLKGIQWAHMGPTPFPPTAYRPKSEKEKQLVLEYAFLWMRTEPQKLPTHHYTTLSFTLSKDDSVLILDEPRDKEFLQIQKSLNQILTPYAKD